MYNQPNNMCNQANYGYYPPMPNPCECGYYPPMYPMYPAPPVPQYNNACHKACEPYREFALRSEIDGEVLAGQAIENSIIYQDMMDLVDKLSEQKQAKIDELKILYPQQVEAKKAYDECMAKCEEPDCHCHCHCHCDPCDNEPPTSYCPECDTLRTTYTDLLRKVDVLEGQVVELELNIPTIECYADTFKRRAESLRVEAQDLLAQAKVYNDKYAACNEECNGHHHHPCCDCGGCCEPTDV